MDHVKSQKVFQTLKSQCNSSRLSPRIKKLMNLYEHETGEMQGNCWSTPSSPTSLRKLTDTFEQKPTNNNDVNTANIDVNTWAIADDGAGVGDCNQFDARFARKLKSEMKRLTSSPSSSPKRKKNASFKGSRIKTATDYVDVQIQQFKFPMSKQKPEQIIRLFQEQHGNYRTLSICGKRINATQRIMFLQQCYATIHDKLGIMKNSADFAWEMNTNIKHGVPIEDNTPAHSIMVALTFNHWANLWDFLQKWCPNIFGHNETQEYATHVKTSTDPVGEYCVNIIKKKATVIQRKPLVIYKNECNCQNTEMLDRRHRHSIGTLWVELHSFAQITDKLSLNSEWKGFVRVHSPFFDLDASNKDQKKVQSLLQIN